MSDAPTWPALTPPTPTEQAEAELARVLRAGGIPRAAAAFAAEMHTERFQFAAAGALTVRLADGAAVLGDAGIEALAAEIMARRPGT